MIYYSSALGHPVLWRSQCFFYIYSTSSANLTKSATSQSKSPSEAIENLDPQRVFAPAKSIGSRLHISRDWLQSICAKGRRSCGCHVDANGRGSRVEEVGREIRVFTLTLGLSARKRQMYNMALTSLFDKLIVTNVVCYPW